MTTLEHNQVSYLTIACTARDRYFDLDAVRHEHTSGDHRLKYPQGRYANSGKDTQPTSERRDGGKITGPPLNPAGAPPLDWFTLPADELSLLLCKAMVPRRVCRECGEPSRRIGITTSAQGERQARLAAHIKERREAAGITSAQINERLGYKEIAKNWERTDPHGAAVPNPDDWAVLKNWLGLSDEFDEFVTARQNAAEYVNYDGEPINVRRADYGKGDSQTPGLNKSMGYRLPVEKGWTDCGHDDWREGVAYDPFPRTEDDTMPATFIVGDALTELRKMPDASVDVVLTSPPFLALRSYLPADHPDKAKEMGSEATPGEYLDRLLDVVVECRRVLAGHGSLVIELGDTYAGGGGWADDDPKHRDRTLDNAGTSIRGGHRQAAKAGGWPLDKSLTGIPQLFMLALTYGRNLLTGREIEPWRVRNFSPWVRPNPPVGALGDKFRPATSYLTVACTSRDRWFDLDAVRGEVSDYERKGSANSTDSSDRATLRTANPAGAPPLDWFNIPTAPYKGAHYATYPPALVTPFVKAMCPQRVCRVCGEPSRRIVDEPTYEDRKGRAPDTEWAHGQPGVPSSYRKPIDNGGMRRQSKPLGWTDCGCIPLYAKGTKWRPGVVLDPFCGSGTTLQVATGHGRDAIGIDLDPRNADLAQERCGMFLTIEDHETGKV